VLIMAKDKPRREKRKPKKSKVPKSPATTTQTTPIIKPASKQQAG
jgi:hypothetical protein